METKDNMEIYVDADACPVIRQAERIAAKYQIPVTLLCDTNHILRSDYSTVKSIEAGADAVDFALISLCQKGDIVITQDYGVAAMALGKGAIVLHQSGLQYTNENIDRMLFERHLAKKERRLGGRGHGKGAHKRAAEENLRFEESLEHVIRLVKGQENA